MDLRKFVTKMYDLNHVRRSQFAIEIDRRDFDTNVYDW